MEAERIRINGGESIFEGHCDRRECGHSVQDHGIMLTVCKVEGCKCLGFVTSEQKEQ